LPAIVLKKAGDLAPAVRRVLDVLMPQLRSLLPGAELHHIGATALPNALTKGDIDVLARVSKTAFPPAVEALRRCFSVRQPENWTPEFASFGDDTTELPLGIQVAVRDSPSDFLLFLHEHFLANPEAVEEYNRLKLAHAADETDGYWQAKNQFLAKILAAGKQ
jgi:GrpB-like predicted nucleotidyltransferase (UPF0157 family)